MPGPSLWSHITSGLAAFFAERLIGRSKLSFALAGAGKAGRGIVDNVEQRAVRH